MTELTTPSCPRCDTGMVRRNRRSDGTSFWACPNFPGCRGTRPIDASPAPHEDSAGRPEAISQSGDDPGGSADRQFAGRRDRHRAAVQAARGAIFRRGALILSLGIATVIAAPPSWRLFGIGVAIIGVLFVIERLYVLPQHVRSWATGGEGERLTAARLDPLRAEGFVVLHDRKIRQSPANIDHIVIGPTGVWVVETKSYGGRIRVAGGELRVNGRRRKGVLEEVEREVAAVARVVAPVLVQPIVVVHRADFPWLGALRIGDVPVVPPGELAKRIRSGPTSFTPDEVTALAARIDRALPHA